MAEAKGTRTVARGRTAAAREWERFLDSGAALLPEELHVTQDLIRAIRAGRLPGVTPDEIPEEFTKIQKNRRVPHKDLKPGMVVGRDRKDMGGKTVLRRGDVLDEQAISDLDRLGIPWIFVVVEHSLIKKSEVVNRLAPPSAATHVQGVTLYVGSITLRAPVAQIAATGVVLLGLLSVWYGAPAGMALAIGTIVALATLWGGIWILARKAHPTQAPAAPQETTAGTVAGTVAG